VGAAAALDVQACVIDPVMHGMMYVFTPAC
jgi:hypothetical protein